MCPRIGIATLGDVRWNPRCRRFYASWTLNLGREETTHSSAGEVTTGGVLPGVRSGYTFAWIPRPCSRYPLGFDIINGDGLEPRYSHHCYVRADEQLVWCHRGDDNVL